MEEMASLLCLFNQEPDQFTLKIMENKNQQPQNQKPKMGLENG